MAKIFSIIVAPTWLRPVLIFLPFVLGLLHVTKINKYSIHVLQNSFSATKTSIKDTSVDSPSSTDWKWTVFFVVVVWSTCARNKQSISKSSVSCLQCEIKGGYKYLVSSGLLAKFSNMFTWFVFSPLMFR